MKPKKSSIKCVVWDLDNTVWDGILLEDTEVRLRPHVVDILKTLDERGILHSIASRNDYDTALAKLQEFGIEEYFLYPQINWNSKAASIAQIAKDINIGLDAIAFVDDQPFEREEVAFSHDKILCIDSAELDSLVDRPELNPRFITEDSKQRRLMYLADIRRNREEEEFVGPKEEFLATLGMIFTIAPCREEDLKRAEELTVRTNQLNKMLFRERDDPWGPVKTGVPSDHRRRSVSQTSTRPPRSAGSANGRHLRLRPHLLLRDRALSSSPTKPSGSSSALRDRLSYPEGLVRQQRP